MNKKITILIPCFNSEKTISRCINSIPTKYDDIINIHILNDGSSDDSLNILKNIQNIRKNSIKIYNSMKNNGLSKAREFLISTVTTNYFIFIDSDDYFIAKNFHLFIDAIGHNPDIFFGKTLLKKNNRYFELRQLKTKENGKKEIINNNFIYFWNILFKTSFIKSININIYNDHCEDWGITDYIFSMAKNIITCEEFTMVYDKTFSGISMSWRDPKILDVTLSNQLNNLFNHLDINLLDKKIDLFYTYLIFKVLILKCAFFIKIKFLFKIKKSNTFLLLSKIKKPKYSPLKFLFNFKMKKIKGIKHLD